MAPHKFDVSCFMMCDGCNKAVRKQLQQLQDAGQIQGYNTVLHEPEQSGDVYIDAATTDYMTVVNKLNKSGKWVSSAKVDGQPVEIPAKK